MSIRGLAMWRSAVMRSTWCALLLALSPFAALGGPVGTPVPEPGPPLYPDLVALPPDDLYLSTELLDDGAPHLLLRFTTSVSNAGEGPLVLEGSAEPGGGGDVSQVVYDAAAGGTMVEQRHLGVDFIYHPEHHHFHLASFASYELLREVPDGGLVPTGQGGKQSSCVLDSRPTTSTGPRIPEFTGCEEGRQGLSVGRQDTYAASLPDQWVDLGSGPLPDGTWVLRYAVGPLRQIAEGGRTANNVAETRFTVREGAIVGRPEPPRCTADGDASGPAGATVTLQCAHFKEGSRVEVYWDGWDPWATDAESIATFSGTGPAAATVTFALPDVAPGGYTITAVAIDYEIGVPVSATVILGVVPGDMATPETGH